RWTLAWMSYQDRLHDASERFAEFAASAQGDEERAQGLYWQLRLSKKEPPAAQWRRVAELDPLGWYGLVAREKLGQTDDAAAPCRLEVAASARRTRIDPYLILAVMRRESLFKPETRSAAGAVGLLQLLPATARRAATVLGRPPLRDEELNDPATAIDLGAWYL